MTKLTDVLNNMRSCRYKNLHMKRKPLIGPLQISIGDRVQERAVRGQSACTSQMHAVLDCFSRHDFESRPCELEIKLFQECFAKAAADKKQRKANDRDGVIPESKGGPIRLTSVQTNNLLKKHAQIRPKDKFK